MDMGNEKQIIENKGKIRENELRIRALINILSKEGITTDKEVEDELKNIIMESEEDN